MRKETLESPPQLAVRAIAGRYQLEKELGEGGMARVWRARDAVTSDLVALKLLRLEGAAARAQFRREYAALVKLQHPRVIRVLEYGFAEDGQPFYTMELIEGKDLLAESPQPWRRACEILRDVCTSLALLHSQRLVHRDVSPRNIRLTLEGHAKLLDFGAIAPFGTPQDVVGTPACMAPEALRSAPIDARTDLFALGAVAYWLLTERTPFAIRKLEDAEPAWRVTPCPPSALVADVPPALDELIVSLLCLDPSGRPSTAPEVLDRLSAIANLDDAPLVGVAESHVSSAALVGRDEQLATLRDVLTLGLQRHGTTVVIAGERGSGKTRLLRELAVEAQLAGYTTVHLSAREHTSSDALCAELVQCVVRRAPVIAGATKAIVHPALAHIARALGLCHDTTTRADEYQHEGLLRTHAALGALLAEVAARTPLLVSIDDAEALEPSAAALLPVLARATLDQPFVVATSRGMETAPAGVELLACICVTLQLRTLELESIEQLVFGTFGDVPQRARLARWLLQASRGNPGQLRRSLLALLERRAIQYVSGAWMLPSDLSEQTLPVDDASAAEALASLSSSETRLLQLLLAHEHPLTRDVCARLLPTSERERVLARLEQTGFVRVDRETVSSLRPQLQRDLVASLPAQDQRALHAQLAAALEASCPSARAISTRGGVSELTMSQLIAAIRVGAHQLLAGDARRALPLLKAGAVELTKRGEGLTEVVPALRRAVDLCREEHRPRTDYAALMTVLTLAGTYLDWRLSYRYGDELIDTLAELGGMKLAVRLRPWLGARLALYTALAYALIAFLLVPRRRVVGTFSDMILGLIGLGTSEVGVCAVLQDAKRAHDVERQLAGLEQFPEGHPAREVRRYQSALSDQAAGNYAAAHARARQVLDYLQSATGQRALAEKGRLQLEVGILILLGQLDACRTDGSAERTLAMLEQVNNATSLPTLAATRVSYHAHRGERAQYLRWHQRVDALAAQQGATWRNDVQLPRWLWSTHMLCGDVVTLKRDFEQLRALSAQVPTIARLRDVLHASYLCERGSPAEALERYRDVFTSVLLEPGLRAAQQLGAYARILRRAGEHAEAVRVCELTLARLTPPERAFPVLTFMLERELPLALAGLGQRDRARMLLDALVDAQASHDNALLHGLAHGARADLAVLERDSAGFDAHLAAMRSWFERTEHPALSAQVQRLAGAMRGGERPTDHDAGGMDEDTEQLEER